MAVLFPPVIGLKAFRCLQLLFISRTFFLKTADFRKQTAKQLKYEYKRHTAISMTTK